MQTKRSGSFISWVLGVLTLVVLVLNPPSLAYSNAIGEWLLFVLLIAFAINMSVLLSSGDISPAHLFSIMAFLILGRDGRGSTALWAVALGALIGSILQVARTDEWLPRRRVTARSLSSVPETMAQLTLSLLVGEALYLQTGGRLPLGEVHVSDMLPLLMFSAGYMLFYVLFFVLRIRLEGKEISAVLASDWITLGGVILLPVPFALLGAIIYHELDPISWSIIIAGLVLVLVGVYGLSRTQFHYRQQVQELQSISVVSQALRTNLELEVLLKTIYLQVASLLDVDYFRVALVNPAQNELVFPLALDHGEVVAFEARPIGSGLIDYVIQRRTPLLFERNVPQQAAVMGLVSPNEPIYSWLGVPLIAPDRALGAMVVASGNPEQLLTKADQRLLMNIATQAGIAIANAQLYGQAQDRALQLATLNSISALLTGSLSPEKVINLVASSMVAVTNCDAMALYLYYDKLSLARNIGLSETFNNDAPLPLILTAPRTGTGELQRAGRQPVVIANSHVDDKVDTARRMFMDREGKRAWLEFMLTSGDEPLGVIVAYYDHPRSFAGEEIDLIRMFTVQAALAINNAQRYASTDIALDRRVNQMQALYDIGQELTATLNLDRVFELVLARALEGTHGNSGTVVVADVENDIQVAAHKGYPANTFDELILNAGLTIKAFDRGDIIIAPDVQQETHYRMLNAATLSQLSVPITRKGETLGVITIESEMLNAFGDDDITFITQLATQAAIAIENGRLFRAVAHNRDQLQVILDSMTEGVLLIDHDGIIAMANPRIASLLEFEPNKMIGQLVDDLLIHFGADFAASLGFQNGDLRMLLANLRAGEFTDIDDHIYTLDARHIDRQIVPIIDDGGQGVIGLLFVFVDITEQQELASAREDLNRMIVHDLRGPLTAISASIKLFNDLAPPDGEYTPVVRRTSESSMRAVRKLLNLVDSLLDIGKMESGQMSLERAPIGFNAIASNAVLEMDTLARELDINLAVDAAYDLPDLDVDSSLVERVILNLMDNALKFTPAGGTVRLAAYVQDDMPGMVRVEVSDTGPGVPDEYKERLFNRFVQVDGSKGRRRGTGLGLTFCRLTVEAHKGNIWIEDNPAGGAVFAFTLPVVSQAQSDAQDDWANADLNFDGPLL